MKLDLPDAANTTGLGIQCCQVPEATIYNNTGLQLLEEMVVLCFPVCFLLSRILKQLYISLGD